MSEQYTQYVHYDQYAVSSGGESVTWSEIVAYQMIYGRFYSTAHGSAAYHAAADQIIVLAEKIKAERAVIAMRGR